MKPSTALLLVIRPTLEWMGPLFQSKQAEVLLLSIGLQESDFKNRQQIKGPAHGFWQMEMPGGVRGVLNHPISKPLCKNICSELVIGQDEVSVHAALPLNDALACSFARLLLYTDAQRFPQIGDAQGSWTYYQRNWRPGKPRPADWPANYSEAMQTVGENP